MDDKTKNGVNQVEEGYLAQSPLDVLAAASAMPGVSPQEMKKELAEVGIEMPGKPKKEKKPHEPRQSGVDSIEEGFLAEPEMSLVEELGAIKYAAAPQEVKEDIEKVKRPDGRLTPNEALLAKLRESGYTGDLEALKRLAEELN